MAGWITEDQAGRGLYADYLYSAITGNWERKRPVWAMLMVNGLTASDIASRGFPVLDLYLAQLAAGLNHVHENRVLHRDLKPQNLLIDNQGNVKLADFGLARMVELPFRNYTHEVVTQWYRPPEILLGQKVYEWGADIWGLGCIFAEMVTNKPLFPGDSEIDQLFRIFRLLGTPTEETWPGVTKLPDFNVSFPIWEPKGLLESYPTLKSMGEGGVELLNELLVFYPKDRISARQALSHQFFAN